MQSSPPLSTAAALRATLTLPVLVAALGYFVDVYDLLLFNIVRVPSLTELGLSEKEISLVGGRIYNFQQAGLLLGGVLWGILGDKQGRLSVLFGSIITYSLANLACGMVHSTETYAWLRFMAGLGLAGELGAGITLVSEVLPKHLRGYGSSVVASVGLLGAVAAFLTVQITGNWRLTYLIGGGLGLALLLLRIGVLESGLYKDVAQQAVKRGNFGVFFTNRDRFMRYLRCMGISLPTYFVIGMLATFGNEFGKALGIETAIVPGKCVLYTYIGMAAGDLFSGLFSQWLQSRKAAIGWMMSFTAVFVVLFLSGAVNSAPVFYLVCGCMGFGIGYIAMFLTITAESFGTNLRATATTSVANNVRATTLLSIPAYQYLKTIPSLGIIGAASVIGLIFFALGAWSLSAIGETYGKELDYVEG
ncbi:MFS transporter [Fibrella forsythiae]|uniref:MFS transporter n=1 Tax=Fibrella forsythiae TaxID=2817061 RepID=A0ABS3JSA0_9BACT|nr:MFS transporter [Fibrella forsythiae]MBO0952333.1 MFS transporter [Fibrella forsythiae]